MAVYHDEVEIEDFEYDEVWWSYIMTERKRKLELPVGAGVNKITQGNP